MSIARGMTNLSKEQFFNLLLTTILTTSVDEAAAFLALVPNKFRAVAPGEGYPSDIHWVAIDEAGPFPLTDAEVLKNAHAVARETLTKMTGAA